MISQPPRRTNAFSWALSFILAFSATAVSVAEPVTTSLPAVADTTLRQQQANQNRGGDEQVRLGWARASRALVRFDPAAITAAVAEGTLISAHLELGVEETGESWLGGIQNVGAHRVTAAWTETGATWNCAIDARPGDNRADCNPVWNGGSFLAVATATVPHTKETRGLVLFDVTADVAAFLAGTASHGWLLKKENEALSGRIDYVSREGVAAERAPRLVVVVEPRGGDTTPPTIVFTSPASGSLLSSSTPTVSATFTDEGSGIDPASVHLLLDDFDRTAEVEVGTTSLLLAPSQPLGEGPHTAVLAVRDLAGNAAQAEVTFTTDTGAPEVTFSSPPAFVQDDATPEIVFAFFDSVSGIDRATLRVSLDGADLTSGCALSGASGTCESPSLSTGAHTVSVQVQDHAGNRTTVSRGFDLDLDGAAPALAVLEPAQSIVVGDPTPALRVEYSDPRSGIDVSSLRVVLNGMDLTASCTVAPDLATCEAPELERGDHVITAQVRDRRGNLATAERRFSLTLPLDLAFTEPAPGSVIGVPVVRVAGTVSPGARSVRINGVEAVLQAGTFAVDDLGLHDGVNNLVAVALDDRGNVGTATVRITADTTPPALSVRAPLDGSVVSSPEVTVTGLVNDLTIGTVSETEVTVTVNGTPATVANRSFLAADVPLVPGPNSLTVVATDRVGNRTAAQVRVTFEASTGQETLRVVSGDEQSAPILTRLPEPLAVRAADAAGQPRPGARVVFRVIQGSGVLGNGKRSQVVTTDAQGEARAEWTLGSRAGLGVDRVRATAVDVAGEAVFLAHATAGPPMAINATLGDAQIGAVGTALALPFLTVLTDGQQNPIAGVPVLFRVTKGDGCFAGGSQIEVETNEQGLASALLTLGSSPGLDNNVVEASFAGMTTRPATFQASAFLSGDPAETRIAGVILDNQGEAVPGVTVRLRDSNLMTTTDVHGQFRLSGVPVGQVFLIADATTASRPGSWASLEFEMFTVAGIENTLPKPIYILPLDLAHGGVYVDETHGGTASIPGIPGFSLDIAPGSVTFPGGSRSGVVSVTAVHADKIPMAPGAGMQPRLIVTIQPAGAHFDPPAAITFPNVDSLPPGTVTELFSFDHDIGAFVSVGTGTVSEDGRVVRSDPGFGVVEAGWHCGARTTPDGDTASMSLDASGRVVLLAGLEPPDHVTISAQGTPPLDAVYSWTIDDPGVARLNPSGDGLCPDKTSCDTEVTAVAVGETTANAKITCTTSGKTAEDKVHVTVVKMHLKEVAFAGTSYREVKEDGSGRGYEAPHWQDNSSPLDGDAEDKATGEGQGDRRFPVSFMRGSKMQLSVKFILDPPASLGDKKILVRGDGPDDLDIPPTVASITSDAVTIRDVLTAGTLPNHIDLLKFIVKWEVSTDDGETWSKAGTSENRVYVTLREPKGTLYETVLDIGCRNAKGQADDGTAVDAIWSDFKGPIPGVKRKEMDGHNRVDGHEMHYWVEEGDPRQSDAGSTCQSVDALLRPSSDVGPPDPLEAIGTCRAWSDLFKAVLQAQGISGVTVYEIFSLYPTEVPYEVPEGPPFKRAVLLVKEWIFIDPGAAPANCGGSKYYLFSSQVVRLPGVEGQGTFNPPSAFNNHFLVVYQQSSDGSAVPEPVSFLPEIYDPSYGNGPYAGTSVNDALEKWEKASIAGFATRCDQDPGQAVSIVEIGIKNDSSKLEVNAVAVSN